MTALWRDEQDVDINDLLIANTSNRFLLDKQLGMLSADLSDLDMAQLRPAIHGQMSRARPPEQPLFMKIHDAYLSAAAGWPPPIELKDIHQVVYLVRDPRDVALSFARHLRLSVDETIQIMADPDYYLSFYPKRVGRHFPQLLSSWSAHVSSWLDTPGMPVRVFRYEDMVSRPAESFERMLEAMDLEYTSEEFEAALRATDFRVLQEKEQRHGFTEKPVGSHRFFHGGVSRVWETGLTSAQRARIEQSHGAVMTRLEYLA